jgi:hypothetical protein
MAVHTLVNSIHVAEFTPLKDTVKIVYYRGKLKLSEVRHKHDKARMIWKYLIVEKGFQKAQ